jgi:alpha-L-rhamnosidase
MLRTLALLFSVFCISTASAQIKVQKLKTENLTNPVGVDVKVPRFGWQLVSPERNIMQTAYEIRVSTNSGLKGGLVWNSGKVNSDSSVHVPYGGQPLKSGQKYFWQVKVWDNKGRSSASTGTSFFQTGLLNTDDWKAKWIVPGNEEDSLRPSPMFRKEFDVAKKIRQATAHITSHGLYEAYLNGRKVGDAFLTPGWTSFNKRLQYQTYDVTNHLKTGKNCVASLLGSGWYRGEIGYIKNVNFYGKDIALLLQLDIEYADGTRQTVVSDDSWKSSTGEILYSEIYHGEWVDARKQQKGWMLAGFDDSKWSGVSVKDFPKQHLIATYNEPIRKKETFKPVKIFKTPNGEQVIDFGQNLVGWVVVKANGKAGDKITIRHAEVLDKKGNFYLDNLRKAKAEAIYYLAGGDETFEPRFTFYGFRYIRIEGYPGDLKPENFTAVALYSDMEPTGTFTSSHALLNQLQHNIQWGQRGNFLDVPTDCPQRDERLGWTGDAQVFSRTAAFNMDVHNFFVKWLKDVAADQTSAGAVPHVVPNIMNDNASASAGWADAATIIPWNMYLAYGDKRILEEQYESMKRWVEFMRSKSKNDLWNTGFHFGDWLFYRPDDDNDGRAAVTDKYLIAQCFWAHSTQLLINTAKLLGKEDDVRQYSDMLNKIRAAFIREYTTPSGRLVSSTQTAYVLALHFDMLPEPLRASSAQRLVDNIGSYRDHLTTGFLGTPYLCHVLTRFGHTDVAYKLLMQETYPSWLYPVKMGATTIWERWDGMKPDSTFQSAGMNSFNHYAYGAIGDWMYRVVTGLDTDESAPGYKKITIRPHPGGGLSHAMSSLESNYGRISSGWRMKGDSLEVEIEIPANTSATVYLPGADAGAISESNRPLTSLPEAGDLKAANGYVPVKLGSGTYKFVSRGYRNQAAATAAAK